MVCPAALRGGKRLSSELEDLVRATEHRGLRPILLTVTEHERPCTTVVSARWVDGQLVVPIDAAAHLPERPFATLL